MAQGREPAGPSAGRLRELVEQGDGTRVVEQMEQIRELALDGRKPEANREAKELSVKLEQLARRLDVLHRDIVAPELAKLVELDRRFAELNLRRKHLETDADIDAWHRQAAELIRELEKAGLTDAASTLADAMKSAGARRGDGPWDWGIGDDHVRVVPDIYTNTLVTITTRLQDRIQDMILKDMVAARDEATPPEYKELVERYYEVLSQGGAR